VYTSGAEIRRLKIDYSAQFFWVYIGAYFTTLRNQVTSLSATIYSAV